MGAQGCVRAPPTCCRTGGGGGHQPALTCWRRWPGRRGVAGEIRRIPSLRDSSTERSRSFGGTPPPAGGGRSRPLARSPRWTTGPLTPACSPPGCAGNGRPRTGFTTPEASLNVKTPLIRTASGPQVTAAICSTASSVTSTAPHRHRASSRRRAGQGGLGAPRPRECHAHAHRHQHAHPGTGRQAADRFAALLEG